MRYLSLLPFFLLCIACATSSGGDPGGDAGAVDTEKEQASFPLPSGWDIVSFLAGDTLERPAVNDRGFLAFTAANLSGNSGCNGFGGEYEWVDADHLLPKDIIATQMFCPEADVQESIVMSVLHGEARYVLNNDDLFLIRDGYEVILHRNDGRLAPANPPATASGDPVTLDGLFIYMADAAVFKRCSDGQRFGVLVEGDAYAELERAYLAAGPGGEWRRTELTGVIEENMAEEGLPLNVRVTGFQPFSPSGECP